jgi:hypothetical protein
VEVVGYIPFTEDLASMQTVVKTEMVTSVLQNEEKFLTCCTTFYFSRTPPCGVIYIIYSVNLAEQIL